MENGVGNPNGGQLGEMKGVEGEVLELKVEENVVVGLHEPKESEGDEVFEEAVGAAISAVDSEDRVVSDDKNSGEVGDLSCSVEVKQNLDYGDEVERFEEAIGAPVAVLSYGEGLEEKDEVLVSEVPPVEEENRAPSEVQNGDRESGEKAELLVTEESSVAPSEILSGGRESGEKAELLVTEELPIAPSEIPDGERESGEKAEILVTEESPVAPIEIPNGGLESGERAELLVTEESPMAPSEIPNRDRESGEKAELLVTESPIASSEIPNRERESGEKAELLVTEESPIVEQAAPEEVLDNVGEGLKHHEVVENGEDEQRDAANVDAAIETPNSKDEDGVSGEVPKKPVNGVHHMNVDLIQDGIDSDKQEKQLHGPPENQNANEVKGGDTDSGQEVESNGNIAHQDVMNIEVNEIYGTLDNGHQEDRSIELENNAASQGSDQGDRIDEQKGDAINLNDERGENKTPELKETKTQSLQPENQGNQDKDVPAISTAAVDDQEESSTLKDNIYSSVEEKTEKSEVEVSPITFDDSSVEERTKAPEVEESPPLEDALAKEVGKVSLSSSDSLVESSGGSQPQLADANGGVSEVVVNQPEKEVEKDGEAKQSIPAIRGQEVKPAMDYSSSTVRSAPAPARPAGLGRAAPLLEPAPRVVQQPRVNGAVSATQNQLVEEPTNGEAEEYDETREKLQMIRVKFLRLAHRLGQTPHNVVVAQVLYRLGLAEQLRGRNGGRVAAFSFDRASAMAEQLEAAGQEPLDFSCTIMVLGKTGVGKSATINSIFDEVKFGTDAFHLGTKKVQDVVGTVQGIKVRVIDTPGLLPSWSDQRQNERILHSVKRFIKKTPPDIVLYLDRLDMQSRDFGDMPLLRTITEIFGPSIWFNAIVVLTHAASAPPEGPNGTATSYDMFVTQRSHAVQQAIRQAAGDMRLMNPVSLVENHSACRTNRAGQRVLPNGQVWKPHLLLLSFASKILAEANALLKLQDSPPGRPFATRTRAPPLPFLLSSLLQSRPQVKLPTDQFGDDDDSLDDDLDESSDSEDESEYDQLPPFRSLTKAQLAKLPRDQKKAYYAELEYREKLFMKKQLKEDKKRRKMFKKMQAMAKDLPADYNESAEEESGGAASVPVPMPDLALPASFDSDNPTHRYRCLDSSNQWLVRPVLEPNGWDHDVGYEGINAERLFVVKDKVPVSFSGQVSKDKKDTNLQMEVATSVKHGEGKATSLGFDMQSVGKDIAYTVRGETKFINYRRNKATTGLSVTILGDTVTGGVKVEDRLIVNKRGQLVVSGGAMFGRGDVAYGGSLEATLRDKDHPLGRFLSTLGLSVMDWHGDLAIGCNSQTQIPIGRFTNLIGRVNINNKGSGQVSIRLNSSEQLQIALIALIPFARKLLGYSQSSQFG